MNIDGASVILMSDYGVQIVYDRYGQIENDYMNILYGHAGSGVDKE